MSLKITYSDTLDDIYYLNTFSQRNIADIDKYTESLKTAVVTKNTDLLRCLRFPGIISDNTDIVNRYISEIYNDIAGCRTPPRGNLTSHSNIIICGIKPGVINSNMNIPETSWLFGPSAKLLTILMWNAGIYPYFTNVFHDSGADEHNGDISQVVKEIKFVNDMSGSVKVVFLGKYQIYDNVANNILGNYGILSTKIWHPSYLARSYSNTKLSMWLKNLIDFIRR